MNLMTDYILPELEDSKCLKKLPQVNSLFSCHCCNTLNHVVHEGGKQVWLKKLFRIIIHQYYSSAFNIRNLHTSLMCSYSINTDCTVYKSLEVLLFENQILQRNSLH